MFTIVRRDSDLHAVRSAEGDRRITMVVSTAPALVGVVQQCTRGNDKHGFVSEDVALVTGDQRERWLGDDGIAAVLDYAAPYRRAYFHAGRGVRARRPLPSPTADEGGAVAVERPLRWRAKTMASHLRIEVIGCTEHLGISKAAISTDRNVPLHPTRLSCTGGGRGRGST